MLSCKRNEFVGSHQSGGQEKLWETIRGKRLQEGFLSWHHHGLVEKQWVFNGERKKTKKNPRIKHKKSLCRAFKNSKCFCYMLGPKGISSEEMHLNGTLRTTSWEQFYTKNVLCSFARKLICMWPVHSSQTSMPPFIVHFIPRQKWLASFHCRLYLPALLLK